MAGFASPVGQVGRSGPRRLGCAIISFPEKEAGPWPWPVEQGPRVVASSGAVWSTGLCPGPHVTVTGTCDNCLAEVSQGSPLLLRMPCHCWASSVTGQQSRARGSPEQQRFLGGIVPGCRKVWMRPLPWVRRHPVPLNLEVSPPGGCGCSNACLFAFPCVCVCERDTHTH